MTTALLARSHLFAHLDTDALATVASCVRRRWYSSGELVFQCGERADGLHVVAVGRIALMIVAPSGRERVVAFAGPGSTLGAPGLFGGAAHAVSALVAAPTLLFFVPARQVARLLREDGAFAANLAYGVAAREYAILRDRVVTSSLSAMQRVAAYLVGLARDAGASLDGHATVVFPVTKTLVASYLDLTRESFSRALACMRRTGLVAVQGARVEIADLGRLRAIL